MTTAFVLGNGNSRKQISIEQLKPHGPIYACNAIYREFTPDVLIATDKPIAEEIQQSGYALKNRFYTRRPLENLGALTLDKRYRGFSSGPNAVAQCCMDGFVKIYMLGFDLGGTNGQFNNVYANTQFYKKSQDPPTFAGNWINQLAQIAEEYSNRQFIRVTGVESVHTPTLAKLRNVDFITVEQFQNLLNTSKGML